MKFKALAVMALTVATFSPAAAQQVRFAGTAMGCFGLDCTPTRESGVDYLNFVGYDFDEIARPDGTLSLWFGEFYWDSFMGTTEIDSPFTLFLSFTSPTGINPDPVYYGNFEGLVIRGKVNGVRTNESTMTLAFEPNQRDYTFAGAPNLPGEFTLTIPDTHILPNERSGVWGEISGATVTPEPLSMMLLGTGLAGVAAARRRRKQQQNA